jgi:Na+/phosphate symporter
MAALARARKRDGNASLSVGAAVPLKPDNRMAQLLIRALPDPPKPSDPAAPLYLEPTALDAASIALTNASRETLRMADKVAAMLRGALLEHPSNIVANSLMEFGVIRSPSRRF